MLTIAQVTTVEHVKEYTPNVIEPSFGLGRIMYALIEHAWWQREGDEQRQVLSFPPGIAPIKCLIAPLSSNDSFTPVVRDIAHQLRVQGISCRIDDSSSSIGRRYARNDELGTPFAITVDFDTLKDNTVTLRARDSTHQVRAPISDILAALKELVAERKSWDEYQALFGLVAVDLNEK
jgi:glycyl-tRNA synthetase